MDSVYYCMCIDSCSQPSMVVANIVIIELCCRRNCEVEPIRCAFFLFYLCTPSGTSHVETVIMARVFFCVFHYHVGTVCPKLECV